MLILLMDVADTAQPDFLEKYGREGTILLLTAMAMLTLLFLVPRLLATRRESQQRQHLERMKALEIGHAPAHTDERSVYAGRAASLVPMVAICAAAAVTCFMSVYRPDYFFSISLVAWTVSGVVSLAAIMGGVALLGRLAQLQVGAPEEDEEEEEHGSSRNHP
jgi:hypothetical protein